MVEYGGKSHLALLLRMKASIFSPIGSPGNRPISSSEQGRKNYFPGTRKYLIKGRIFRIFGCRSTEGSTLRKSALLEKERYYSTRGSVIVEENGKVSVDVNNNGIGEERGLALPKLCITLSSKEKEEDFMAMKGCKPPQRPKKRAKIIQRSVLLVSPGAWLTDMCHERYEVREKKNSKKRPRGLKAMGSMDSDSE
ncbi:hypothetical protein F2P56_010263 [Juglans regia]|uniref:Uncharacterized protein n=1 Tax=Juglans regia TaxID=51240 RepID=A0A834CXH3_JUGRE|nr:hypothetical protein F2P56_010263 [Juglans regia]